MLDDETSRAKRLANAKLAKEAADFLFRVVQMWIVLALVVYMQKQTGAWIATAVMFALTGSLMLYCYNAPKYMMEDWSKTVGSDPHGLYYLVALIAMPIVAAPLLFSDMIIDGINVILHPDYQSLTASSVNGAE